jgi:hypothetical protein
MLEGGADVTIKSWNSGLLPVEVAIKIKKSKYGDNFSFNLILTITKTAHLLIISRYILQRFGKMWNYSGSFKLSKRKTIQEECYISGYSPYGLYPDK